MSECEYPKPWTWKVIDDDIVFYCANGVPIFSDIWCESEREKAADIWCLRW